MEILWRISSDFTQPHSIDIYHYSICHGGVNSEFSTAQAFPIIFFYTYLLHKCIQCGENETFHSLPLKRSWVLTVHSIRYLFNGQECILCQPTCIHIWILLPLILSYVVILLRVTWNFTDCLNWTANVNTTFKCSYHHNTLTQSLYRFQNKKNTQLQRISNSNVQIFESLDNIWIWNTNWMVLLFQPTKTQIGHHYFIFYYLDNFFLKIRLIVTVNSAKFIGMKMYRKNGRKKMADDFV